MNRPAQEANVPFEIEIKYAPFGFSAVGRLAVRALSYATYCILSIGAIAALLAEEKPVRAIGILTTFFLIKRLIERKKGEKTLSRISEKIKKINAAEYATPDTLHLLERALDRSRIGKGSFETLVFLLAQKRREIREAFRRIDKNPDDIRAKLEEYEEAGEEEKKERSRARAERLLAQAFFYARDFGGDYIEPKDVVSALVRSEELPIQKINRLFGIVPNDLDVAMSFAALKDRFKQHWGTPRALAGFLSEGRRKRSRQINRSWTARPTPTLNRWSIDLTALAEENAIGLLIGHKNEYERLIAVLSRPGRHNAILVGDPGVGKGTMLGHLAYEIRRDRVPSALFDKRLLSFDISAALAGIGEAEGEERIRRSLEEAQKSGNIILHLPNIHALLREGSRLRISELLTPLLEDERVIIIGDTSPKDYKLSIAGRAFGENFESISVEEISEAEAIHFLSYEALALEFKHKIVITIGALKSAVILAHKYFRDKLLPGSASDVLREAVALSLIQGKKEIGEREVIHAAEKRTAIPLGIAEKKEATKLLKFEEEVHKRFIDQDEAVNAVARALREYRAGLKKKGGPIATFLFVGPTGVGKTELSKQIARIQFGEEKNMTRLDMSEYQNRENIYQLIGSPKGEIGGSLTDAVTDKPYSLILLDEFEKAHPDIVNLFLQVFDDGRLTDSVGRTVQFDNTIIVATSNAHSILIKEEIEKGASVPAIAELLKQRLTEYFKPELLNRFTDIIVFKPLSINEIKEIAALMLKDLKMTLLETHGIEIMIEETAIEKIAELGFDPVFGARPLRGVISEKIRSILAERILKEEIARGASVKIEYKDSAFQMKVTKA